MPCGVFRLGKIMKRISLGNWMLAATAAASVLVLVADAALAQSSGHRAIVAQKIAALPFASITSGHLQT